MKLGSFFRRKSGDGGGKAERKSKDFEINMRKICQKRRSLRRRLNWIKWRVMKISCCVYVGIMREWQRWTSQRTPREEADSLGNAIKTYELLMTQICLLRSFETLSRLESEGKVSPHGDFSHSMPLWVYISASKKRFKWRRKEDELTWI